MNIFKSVIVTIYNDRLGDQVPTKLSSVLSFVGVFTKRILAYRFVFEYCGLQGNSSSALLRLVVVEEKFLRYSVVFFSNHVCQIPSLLCRDECFDAFCLANTE